MDAAMTVKDDEHAELIALRAKVAELEQQIAYFQKQLFGRKSEQTLDSNQMSLFIGEFEAAQAALKATNEAQAKKTQVKGYDRKRKNAKEKLRPDLEVVKAMIDLTPEENACDSGWQLVSVGQHFVRTAVEFVPAKMVRREYFIKFIRKSELTVAATRSLCNRMFPMPSSLVAWRPHHFWPKSFMINMNLMCHFIDRSRISSD
ncbi:transposase domain-containing protein [Lacticaseibacillus paracasei]|uniref:transposase domain-containing protein n=1 Tax=Lacticaseibacillus paracasei TaxID=1597 RepID=UPI0040462C02